MIIQICTKVITTASVLAMTISFSYASDTSTYDDYDILMYGSSTESPYSGSESSYKDNYDDYDAIFDTYYSKSDAPVSPE